MSEKKVLTIERSKWRRGGDAVNVDAGPTCLLNKKGLMCCLGFDALAFGLTEEQILLAGQPDDIDRELFCEIEGDGWSLRLDIPEHMRAYFRERWDRQRSDLTATGAIWRAIEANDAPDLSDEAREAAVRAALIALGWDDVIFV